MVRNSRTRRQVRRRDAHHRVVADEVVLLGDGTPVSWARAASRCRDDDDAPGRSADMPERPDDDGDAEQGGRSETCLWTAMNADQLLTVFSFLDGYSIGRCTRVCREWRRVSEISSLWQKVCRAVFGPPLRLYKALSWKDKFLHDAHLRYDGIYCLQVTYWAQGSAQSNYEPLKFSYYRYLRFFPNRKVWYSLMNDPPPLAINRYMARHPGAGDPAIFEGEYRMKSSRVSCIVAMRHMTAGLKVVVHSTIPGAFNRLKFVSLVSLTSDREIGCEFRVPNAPFTFIHVNW